MNAQWNKFVFSNEQPSNKRMVLCGIFYAFIIPFCIYTYILFLSNFGDDADYEMKYRTLNVKHETLKKELDIAEIEVKAAEHKAYLAEELCKELKKKLDIKPIVEQHIMTVNHYVFPQLAKIYSNAIMEAANKYPNIPYNIILAVMELESTFKYTAKSNKDCIGLMQVNPAVWLAKDNPDSLISAGIASTIYDLYDPRIKIIAGTYILNHYYEKIESDNVKSKWEGALNKYFGAQSKEYFEKFQKFFGNFNLYLASYKE